MSVDKNTFTTCSSPVATFRARPQSNPCTVDNKCCLRAPARLGDHHRSAHTGWRKTGGVGGLSTVKSMALISRTPKYETFLANTRAGTLVTVTWPTSAFSVPRATTVRGATWQGFEQLLATKCGANGTLLLGIDRDTQSGYLYAVSHANGGSTVIKSLGKVPMTFSDPQYFRWAPTNDTLNGA
jgi:hypothetical protein